MLAWVDVRNSFKRTSLGPFWSTINSGVMIFTLWAVFGHLFTDSGYFPYLATGIIFWSLISGPIAAASSVFTSNESLIRSTPLPIWSYVARTIAKYFFVFGHSFIVIPIVVLVSFGEISRTAWLSALSFAIVIGNVVWFTSTIAFLSTRYRDFGPIVGNIMTVLFYLTPIFWKPDILHPTFRESFLAWNPFYYLTNLLREPWLGNAPSFSDWAVGLSALVIGALVNTFIYLKLKNRVAFWL